jgi:hypothetical protein
MSPGVHMASAGCSPNAYSRRRVCTFPDWSAADFKLRESASNRPERGPAPIKTTRRPCGSSASRPMILRGHNLCTVDRARGEPARRPASVAPPTGCSCHDLASSGCRGGRRRSRARPRGLARYLGPGTAACATKRRDFGTPPTERMVVRSDTHNCAKASSSSREITLN